MTDHNITSSDGPREPLLTLAPISTPSPLSATPAPRSRNPFRPDRVDAVFALVAFALGFLFIRWVFFFWQGWGVAFFTVAYCSAVTLYLRRKSMQHIPRTGLFWLVILLLTGLSFGLWDAQGLSPYRELFLFGTAIYWVMAATRMPLRGQTSDWLPLDGLNGLLVIPFGNFGTFFQSLGQLRTNRGTAGKQFLSIGLGLLFALLVMSTVIPLLIEADTGGFAQITEGIWRHFRGIRFSALELLVSLLFAIPTTAYIFGLVAGCAYRRGSADLREDKVEPALNSLRLVPSATALTTLSVISALYLVFIASQLPYFFSAFAGQRPNDWLLYSEYARNGFFELARIATINLSLLVVANLGSRRPRQENTPLRLLNCLLASLTLLLIATAMSKMVLYIAVYGLSIRRLLPCVFMVFLAIVYGGVVALQWRRFSIMRLAAGVGAVMLVTLSLVNADALVARYNASRYLAGTLTSFDVSILHQAGAAGVEPALRVYSSTSNEELQMALNEYLLTQQYRLERDAGGGLLMPSLRPRNSLENIVARQKVREHMQSLPKLPQLPGGDTQLPDDNTKPPYDDTQLPK